VPPRSSRTIFSSLNTSGTLRGSRTNVRCRAISARPTVTLKKNRSAATEQLMVGGRTPRQQ
jgi:hypothetical protein